MLDTLLATLAILATWAAWGSAFVAVGSAVFPAGILSRGRIRSRADSRDAGYDVGHDDRALRLLVWFWSGWCAVVLFLQVWHLALPVDVRAVGVVGGLAIVAGFVRQRELRAVVVGFVGAKPDRLTLLIAAAIGLVWANLATGEIRITDTGLYHMQSARWNAAYPIVTGLGNLHGRLAYNNASLLYAALVDVGPWSHGGHHVAGGLLALGCLLPLAASIAPAIAGPADRDAAATRSWLRHVARALLVIPAMLHASRHATSLSPDLPATLLGTVLAVVLIELCLGRAAAGTNASGGDGARLSPTAAVALVALLSATAVSVKLSTIATGGVATLVAVWLARISPARCLLAAAVFAVAVGPWCARGVILSGYLAYPSQAVAFDVPWRVPREWAEEDRRTIVAWARDPERNATEVLADWSWVGPWSLRQAKDVLGVTLPLAAIAACIAVIARDRKRRHSRVGEAPPRLWPAALPFVAAVVFLLATAPDLARFGGASLWIIAVVAATTWLAERRQSTEAAEFRAARRIVVAVAVVLAVIAAGKIGRFIRFTGGLAPIPQAELRTVRTDSGLELHVPADSDRGWDAPLPSTPYAKPQLTLRREGDLGAGFEHRGAR